MNMRVVIQKGRFVTIHFVTRVTGAGDGFPLNFWRNLELANGPAHLANK